MEAKNPQKVTILHLSDLHFRSDTDVKQVPISALKTDLLQFRDAIDLVACTGDLTDNPLSESRLWNFFDRDVRDQSEHELAMQGVRRFLKGVCNACKVDPQKRLFVVPGNHDYRIQGLVHNQASVDLFNKYFSEYFRNALIPELNLLIYSFDSNSTDPRMNFATGLVTQDHLVSFKNQLLQWKNDYSQVFGALNKIALVHHHPMPISETEKRAVRDGEEFVLLKNAGTFMKEMVKGKIDLVLHGHKHFVGYSRTRFPLVDGVHEVAIVAAGSAGQPFNDIYSYNLLTVPADGPIKVEQRVLNKGTYETSFSFTMPENYTEWRQIRFQKFLNQKPITVVGEVDFTEVAVKESGDSERHAIVKGMEAKEEDVECLKWVSASVVAKFEEPVCLCLNRPDQSIDLGSKTSVGGRLDYEMIFSPPLRKGRPLDVEIRRSANNAFFFDVQDRLDVTGSKSKTEYVSWSRQSAYKLLDMKVRFLHDHRVMGPRVEVLDTKGNVHDLETDYCLTRFTYSEEKRVAHLAVDFPVPGNAYKIVWNLPKQVQSVFVASERKKAEAIEDELFQCLEDQSKKMTIMNLLEELKGDLSSHFNLKGDDEDFELALMAFHRDERLLVTVVGLYPTSHPIFGWRLKKGQGIEGQALRRRSWVYAFESGGDSEWKKYHVDPPFMLGQAKGYSLLFVVPLTYPFNSERIVALLRLASASKTSNLLSLEKDVELPAS